MQVQSHIGRCQQTTVSDHGCETTSPQVGLPC